MKMARQAVLPWIPSKLLLDQVGLQPEYEESLWVDVLDKYKNHTGPDILPVVARTAEREDMMHLTSDYISFPLVIITQKNAPFVSGMDDLSNHIVSVERGFIAYNELMADYPHIQLLVTDTTLEALQAVSTNKGRCLHWKSGRCQLFDPGTWTDQSQSGGTILF